MGKIAIILIAGLGISLGIMNYNTNRETLEAVDNSAEYYNYTAAQNLTKSALNYSIFSLKINPDLRGTFVENHKYVDGGIDTVTITDGSNDTINVSITGWFGNHNHELFASLLITGDNEWPYAIFADNDVKFEESGTVNGDVHANNTVDNSGGVAINGSVTMGGSKPLPTVNWSFYENQAITAGQRITGEKEFEGETVTGVWYVTNTVTIKRNTSIRGTIVSLSDIIIEEKQNVTIEAAPTNYPALVSNNSIIFQERIAAVKGILYAYNDIKLDERHLDAEGALIAGTTIEVKEEIALSLNPSYTTNVAGIDFGDNGEGGNKRSVKIVSLYK